MILQVQKLKRLLFMKFIKIGNKLNLIKPDSCYYMGGVNVLPPPLTVEEEKELLKKLEYDEFENTGIDMEDLISIGTIGLIKAVNTFNLDKNIKLATYASRCIENEILMCLRKNNKKKSEVSFDEPLNVDLDGNELLLSDVLGTDNDEIYKIIEEEIDKNLLFMALDKLSYREKQIMELRFGLSTKGKEKTQKEVANILGISQSYISRLEKKIIFRLKKEMKKFV